MAYENIYFKTRTRDEFVKKMSRKKLVYKTISNYYGENKKKYGTQDYLHKKYSNKYELEYIYTKGDMKKFVDECLKNYIGLKKRSIERAYYDVKKRLDKPQSLKQTKTKKVVTEENQKIPELYKLEKKEPRRVFIDEDDDNFIPINEVVEPSHIKMIQLFDMKKYGYRITDYFLEKHGFTKYEINWLKYQKIIK